MTVFFENSAIAFQKNDPAKSTCGPGPNSARIDECGSSCAAFTRKALCSYLRQVLPNLQPTNHLCQTESPEGLVALAGGGDGRSSLPTAADARRSTDSDVRIKSRGSRFDVEYRSETGTNAYQLTGLTHEDAVDVAALIAARAKRGEAVIVSY